jgi:hypothetical protein
MDFKLVNEEYMWQQVLKKKYFEDKTLSQVKIKKGDWKLKVWFWREEGSKFRMVPKVDFERPLDRKRTFNDKISFSL